MGVLHVFKIIKNITFLETYFLKKPHVNLLVYNNLNMKCKPLKTTCMQRQKLNGKNSSFKIYNPKCKVYRRVLRVSSTRSWVSSTGISLSVQTRPSEKEGKIN